MTVSILRWLATSGVLLAASGLAAAHPGHGEHGPLGDFSHLLEPDHLLAIVLFVAAAVTLVRGASRRHGSAGFVVASVVGVLAGAAGLMLLAQL